MTDQQDARLESVAQRVTTLETEKRVLERRLLKIRSAALVVAVLAALALLGVLVPGIGRTTTVAEKTLRTQELVLVDAHGRQRGRLGFKSDGAPILELQGDRFLTALTLTVEKDGPAIHLSDNHDTTNVVEASLEANRLGLLSHETGVRWRIDGGVILARDGLTLYGRADSLPTPPIAILGADAASQPSLELFDNLGRKRLILTTAVNKLAALFGAQSQPSLQLFDGGGKVIFRAP